MSTSMLLGLFSWIGDFFKSLFDLIPKIMYLLYSSMACVLDVLQLFFRKLAGLDVYYVDGKPITGDIVTNFVTGILGINKDNLTYSALSTVFWSMIVFGIILCFACTIFAVIKSHYNYDEKAAKGPMQYVYTAGKAILNMAVVPIMVVLGMYVSEALLTALDAITSTNSGTIEQLYGSDVMDQLCETETRTGKKTKIYYDLFGVHSGVIYGAGGGEEANAKGDLALIASTNQPFSGSMFKVAAYNANRARLGQITTTKKFTGGKNAKGSFKLFKNARDDKELADMIDTAFACNLHAKNWFSLEYDFGDIVSFRYFTNYLTIGTNSFSKFNVGLVWYYYDLWQFNFIVAFAGIIVCISIFINVILGMITRLFMCIVLFLVAPPLFGLAPLDGGKAGKGWRENFMKQALMAYGAVVGMNLVLMILPYMNEIDFFNIAIADYFAQALVIIVGLITIKAVIATLSGLIGAADANETGGKIKDEVADVAGKATKMTVGAAKIGGKIGGKVGMAVGSDLVKAGGLLGKGLNKVAGGAMGLVGGGVAAIHAKATGGKAGAAFKSTLGKAWGAGGTGIAKSGAGKVKNWAVGSGKTTRTKFGQFLLGGQRRDEHGHFTKKKAGVVGNAKKVFGATGRGLGKAGNWIAEHSAIGGMIKGGASSVGGKVGGMLSIANSKLSVAKASIEGHGIAGAISKALGDASKNIKLGKHETVDKDGNKVKHEGVLSGMMTLFHDGTMKADSGLAKFNDSSGIKKKPEHDKATAESTAAMAKNTDEMRKGMASMTKAVQELASALNKKPPEDKK